MDFLKKPCLKSLIKSLNIGITEQIKLPICLIILPFFFSQAIAKPSVESFENVSVLNFYQKNKNSQISISSKHAKFGQHALHWQWQGESKLSTQYFQVLSHEQSPLKYGHYFPASPTMSISLYSEQIQTTSLRISFDNSHKKNKEEVWFDLPLNFTGWRIFWVPFHEMKGNAPKKNEAVDFDTFSISSNGKGNVYIDDIIFSQYQDDRFPYPNQQTAFVQQQAQQTASDHWMPLISDLNKILSIKLSDVNSQELSRLQKIEGKITEILFTQFKEQGLQEKPLSSLIQTYQSLGIVERDGYVQGPPLTYNLSEFYFDEKQQGIKQHNTLKTFGKFLKDLALSYSMSSGNDATRTSLEQMFISSVRYYLDQGWQAGSAMGTLHHVGYSTDNLAQAMFLMRHTLEEAGLINVVGKSLHWLFNQGKIIGDKQDFHANIDYMNTQAFYHLMLTFLHENRGFQTRLLDHFSKYISIILAQSTGDGVFKIDGTAWHHGGHYPAYAVGAFEQIPKIIYVLADSRFKISAQGHANFKRAFLASRIYSQPFDFGFGNAGRHPFDGSFDSLKYAYALMMLAGDPKHEQPIDEEVAAAFVRLWPNDREYTHFFRLYNIQAEDLSGYYTFPYAATAVHRQANWAALIKGYSKYVWSSEIYVASNRYGRYPANGTVQLINESGELASGYQQNGWNWNGFPGATVIELPIEKLETNMPLLMFRSQETFAGGVELNGRGLFSFQLNEENGFNHEIGKEYQQILSGGLKGKKSVFSFNDKLIFIGTDIQSTDKQYPVNTHLFQSFLPDTSKPIATSSFGLVSKFPFAEYLSSNKGSSSNKKIKGESRWLIDPYGNGYHILSDQQVQVNRQHQQSYHNKYSLLTGKMNPKGKGVKKTEGNFASAWLTHGLAPNNQSYQYVVYPFVVDSLSQSAIEIFSEKIENDESYRILQADNKAHIVKDNDSQTIAYAIFDEQQKIEHGVIAKTSKPALLMDYQQSEQLHTISVVQPDLNFPQLKPIIGYSQPVELTITLEGRWQVLGNNIISEVEFDKKHTQIKLICQHGLPLKFDIKKR